MAEFRLLFIRYNKGVVL
ncbi:hypothetical protein AVEN_183259-1, partial [Araneus ventricosus]